MSSDLTPSAHEGNERVGAGRLLTGFAVSHPVSVLMIFIATTLLGVLALRDLPVDLLPELDAPRVAVLIESGDRPPEELEDAYARPMENVLSTLSGVRHVKTLTSTGRVLATIEYEWDANMDFALLDVQKQVAAFGTDRDVDSLVVRRFDPAEEPILVLALSEGDDELDDDALDRLRRLAEDRLARALERIPGVASVQVAGGRQREIRVTAEGHRLGVHGLDFSNLSDFIRQANQDTSGGTVEDEGRVHVIKGIGRFKGLADVRDLPLPMATRGGQGETGPARPLRLSEIAKVEWDVAPVRGLVRVNGREGLSLAVFKEAGENTVAVSDRIVAAVATLQAGLGEAELTLVQDQAGFIRQAIEQVQWSALAGAVLAVLVLFLFLRSLPAVVLVGLAIPISVIGTFALMGWADLSLNVMTLGGLALGAGMLIDNAIVVLESIFRRLENGEEAHVAAELGAAEVAAAISASTLTTCVVFLPITFLHGVAAELFTDLAFTVAFSLLCSLLVALLLIPAAAARLFKSRPPRRVRDGEEGARGVYPRLLSVGLRRPATVLVVALLLVVGGIKLIPGIGLDFLPTSDPGELTVRLQLPEGSRVTVTDEACQVLESALRASLPDSLAVTLSELGEAVREQVALSDEIPSENSGLLRVRLVSREAREVTTEQVMALLDQAAENVEGLTVRFEPTDPVLGQLAESGPPVRVVVRGQDLKTLERGAEILDEGLSRLPELFNVHSSFEDRRVELRLELDRTITAGLGFTPDSLARQVRQRLGAETVTDFRLDGEQRNVVVRAPASGLRGLPQLLLNAPSGEPVRLGDLTRVVTLSSPTRLERSGGGRVGAVTAQLAPGVTLGQAGTAIEALLPELKLPAGVRAELVGAESVRRSSFKELLFAVVLAVAFVAMLLASLFESIVHPFTILFTLPTAGVGVVAALAVTGTPFSVPALLGAVMLAGIAVNNGILLVDLTGRLRASGLDRDAALLKAGAQRLRPILMTSMTTVLGMVPLALGASVFEAFPLTRGWGEGAELRAPMALAVIGGLIASTFLTLFLVPVVYGLLDRLGPQSKLGVSSEETA